MPLAMKKHLITEQKRAPNVCTIHSAPAGV